MSELSKPAGASLKVNVTFALSPAFTDVTSLVILRDGSEVSTSNASGLEADSTALDASTTRATKLCFPSAKAVEME